MFGILDDIVSSTVKVATLGAVDRCTVLDLAKVGLTAYEISEVSGIALDVIEEALK